MEKCVFAVLEVEFLGFIVTADGLKVDPKKVEAVVNWSVPRSTSNVREFVGFAQYLRRSIKDFSLILAPVTDTTKGSQNFKWTPEAQKAFEEIKVVMTTLPVLKLPEFDKPFEIHADASRIALGVVLMQEGRPVAYISKKFSDREKRWATHEQDMVDWGFLEGSLDRMGFPLAWIKGISALYRSASSSVTIGEHVGRTFQLSRSVRQGCPLAPYLFLLVAETMSDFIRAQQSALKGLLMPVADEPNLIDHEYADDTLLFLHYSTDVLDKIQYALEVGLDVTPEQQFSPDMQSMRRKLCYWSSQHLSLAGRALVANQVLLASVWYISHGDCFDMGGVWVRAVAKVFLAAMLDMDMVGANTGVLGSKTWEEHQEHVRLVLQRLRERKWYAKMEKCVFAVPEVEFLGFIVTADGLKVDPKKVEAVVNWPVPRSTSNVREFVGFAQYLRRSIKDFSLILAPVTDTTKGSQNFKWTPEAQKAFEEIKVVITTLPVLKLPEFDKPFEIHADASCIALGVVLMQEGKPVAYISKKFSDREKRWATHEQDMYAVVYCLDQWRHYVLDKHTKIYTDNVSLKYFQTQPKLSPKQMRWQDQLAEYDIEIIHKPGKHNVMPDALSRIHEINAVSVISSDEILDQIRNASKTDPGVLRMMQNWRQGKTAVGLFDLRDGLWYAHDRIYIPDEPSLRPNYCGRHMTARLPVMVGKRDHLKS
ncbi:hypothetical protein L7F22_024676 [Adiantum nelumboides]|nr:hypothetical protein [Adiantum nelumboides]